MCLVLGTMVLHAPMFTFLLNRKTDKVLKKKKKGTLHFSLYLNLLINNMSPSKCYAKCIKRITVE